LTDIVVRFFIGGLVVSVFSLISDLLRPKTFAGLFGAAPSVALATLGLTILKEGKQYAAVEARSMILGAIALLVYAAAVSYVLLRFKLPAFPVTLMLLIFWLGVATGLWYVFT
jgi:hypothetical protein